LYVFKTNAKTFFLQLLSRKYINISSHFQTKYFSLIFIFINIVIESLSVGPKQSQNEEPINIKEPPNLSTIKIYSHENRVFDKLSTIDQQWVNENRDTFISYSCSEGLLLILKLFAFGK
jgi:hypothetical protein